jgi:ubiquinone/menaquinone biosynthesis C-methylase UbiE
VKSGRVNRVKSTDEQTGMQKKLDFTTPRPRPFLTNLPARITTYEEGVARFFQWRTGLDYYATIDQVVDFSINTRRQKVVDLLADTAAFALLLAGRKAFLGRVYAFDTNVTLLERAKQRALHLSLAHSIEFRHNEDPTWPVPDGFCDLAVSIFDLHRRSAPEFLREACRILSKEGHLILAEMIEPQTPRNRLRWAFRMAQLRYIQKNPAEALAIYYDRDSMIQLLLNAGFRQVVMQDLTAPKRPDSGVFSLVAATK